MLLSDTIINSTNSMRIKIRKTKTARKRLASVALYWGLPVTCAELFFGPRLRPWELYLAVAVPIFVLATATAFVIELWLVRVGQHFTGP